jgi:endonuclease YncB( thermonuclease family)
MGTVIPFIPFQNRCWVKKVIWKTGTLEWGDPFDTVHDGDTCYLFTDKGERQFDNRPCRLYGIDTDEINAKDIVLRESASKQRNFLRPLIDGKEVFVIKVAIDPYDRPVVIMWDNKAKFGDRAQSINRLLMDTFGMMPYMQNYGPLD